MDGYGEPEGLDFERYPKSEGYEVKRVVAYLIDQLFVFIIVALVALVALPDAMGSPLLWILIVIISGFLNVLLKSFFEGMGGRFIGKGIMGLRVIDAYGQPTVGQCFIRNILEIVPVILPIIDYFIGTATAEDKRQKLMDSITGTLVIEEMLPEPEPEFYRPRPIKVQEPKSREKVMLDYRKFRSGTCPRCGSPYRILEPEDKSFSGLWNFRCTWCNNLITEEADRLGGRRR
ncbi:MAG: RDD family protein [Thermoplasmatota archaeon]